MLPGLHVTSRCIVVQGQKQSGFPPGAGRDGAKKKQEVHVCGVYKNLICICTCTCVSINIHLHVHVRVYTGLRSVGHYVPFSSQIPVLLLKSDS